MHESDQLREWRKVSAFIATATMLPLNFSCSSPIC